MSGKTHIIAIAGPSCAGKTESAKAVARLLHASILSLDSYYLNLDHLPFEQRVKFNYDEPAALEHELLVQHLHDLALGRRIQVPVYDFAQYTRSSRVETVHPVPYVIVEGLFVLYWEDVRRACDTTVYVDAPDALCLERRKHRDVLERGRTVESVLRQYDETVRPMASKYVWPTRNFAELIVSGTDSLEHCAQQVLAQIRETADRSARPVVAGG